MRRPRRGRVMRILVAGLVLLAAVPGGIDAANSGTVQATVTGAAPCVTVSGSFAFGTLPFSTSTVNGQGFASGVSAQNCGAQAETFLVRGSAATNGTISWTLGGGGSPCAIGVNRYSMTVYDTPTTSSVVSLTTTDQTFLSAVPANASQSVGSGLTMPCTGSDGAGLEMTSTITLTATF